MKTVILAGGRGSRLSEETGARPKPLVEVGGKPILWHIMKTYASHGINDFVVCAGYLGYMIKEYFSNLALHGSDVTFDLGKRTVDHHNFDGVDWRVTVVDTGIPTMTAGRVKRVRDYLDEDLFLLTYGDGVGDVDISATIEFHRAHGLMATMTTVRPLARFGMVELDGHRVVDFHEKDPLGVHPVNGGFFVVDRRVVDLIKGDDAVWESDVLPELARWGQLAAYEHKGFWQPMDTAWERDYLERLWMSGDAPWAR